MELIVHLPQVLFPYKMERYSWKERNSGTVVLNQLVEVDILDNWNLSTRKTKEVLIFRGPIDRLIYNVVENYNLFFTDSRFSMALAMAEVHTFIIPLVREGKARDVPEN